MGTDAERKHVAMPNWLKRNAVLVMGISLPLILILLVLLTQALTRLGHTPPAHPVVYATFDHYSPQLYFDFRVDAQGRLEATAKRPETQPYGRATLGNASIAVFDAASDTHESYTLRWPDDLGEGEEADLELPAELTSMRISGAAVSPDGYRFESGYRGSNGLFPSLFGGGSRRRTRLVNDGAIYEVPEIAGHLGSEQLIGWVIDDD